MIEPLLSALSWEPQIKGGLYVLLAVLILPGSVYVILATDTGARLGFQLAAAGLSGFLVILGSVWWVYGIGPKGPAPTWKPVTIISGDPGQSRPEILNNFPKGWEKLEPTDPEVADAQPVVDGDLTNHGESGGTFKTASDYIVVGAATRGGETYAPLGLPAIRPINILHKPHNLVVQVQPVIKQETTPGAPPPRPAADPAAPVYTVLLLRDLGHLRLNPAVATISAALLFGLLTYQLHTRDKEAMAKRG
ncbi:MAG: hypothetical protein QOE93_1434 [Actinomycetota bacterium]|nr:hypothetical protein [Actinomycetota bacterium]